MFQMQYILITKYHMRSPVLKSKASYSNAYYIYYTSEKTEGYKTACHGNVMLISW